MLVATHGSALIPVYGRHGIVAETLVSDADAPWIRLHRWHINKSGYVWRHHRVNGRWTTVKLYREISNAPPGMDVDHINGNKLDNRRDNLRVCTHAQNMMNHRHRSGRVGFRGVRKTRSGTWQARISHQGREIHVGNYDTQERAIYHRIEAEVSLRGQFAPGGAQ